MPLTRSTLIRFCAYVALYVAGAEFAVVFLDLPTDVTLIWPSAGLAYAVLLFHGLQWWPVIPTGILLIHLLVSPAPPAFVPFSLASNTVGTVLACALVTRFAGRDLISLRVQTGFVLLLGGVVIALVGSLIGVSGMYANRLVPADAFWVSLAKWAAGDLFGIVVITPFTLMVLRSIERGALTDTRLQFPGWTERIAWLTASVLSCLTIVRASVASPAYALGLSFVPLTMLLWSALRFEPIVTAGATALYALTVVTLIGLSVGGFSAPSDLLETFILLALLSTMAIVPQLVATANFRVRAAAHEMLQRARLDKLTGLPNRTSFEEQVTQALARRSEGSRGALGYLDLDQFKLINDTASHSAGDEAIRQLASVMRASLPPEVELARLGADEFGMLWRDADTATVEAQTRTLRQHIAGFRFAHGDRLFAVTASIGLVPFPTQESNAAALFAQADSACYVAKEQGGNRVHVHHAEDAASIERHAAMDWVVRINNALEQEKFELYGQRILNFADDSKSAFEVLLRLKGDDGEHLSPSRFIPAAERFSMASRIDRHVFDRALRWLETDAAGRDIQLNINLSAATLADEDFVQFLRQRLRSSSVAPAQICIEVTETSAVRDLTHARRFIAQFRAMGVRFALDDFGTGFCSFAYLRDLDVDVFKIDGSFVRDLTGNSLSLAIVRSIVEIAQVLGKRTVGEAVEDTATGRLLRELGVDAVQGYAYHRPEPLRLLLG